jgi:hypothetical protein
VGASSTFITAATSQAAAGAAINLAYLALLEVKKPMPYRPSRTAWFKGQNFFHLAERSSASTSLAGSLLAVLGATSRSLVDVFGTIFAIMNIAYVATVMYAFAKSSKKGHSIIPTIIGVDIMPTVSKDSAIEKLTSEWCVLILRMLASPQIILTLTQPRSFHNRRKGQVQLLDESEGLKPEVLEQMKKELLLMRGKAVANLERELQSAVRRNALPGGGDGEALERCYNEADQLVRILNMDSERLGLSGSGSAPVKKAKQLVPDGWLQLSLEAQEEARKSNAEYERAIPSMMAEGAKSAKSCCVVTVKIVSLCTVS